MNEKKQENSSVDQPAPMVTRREGPATGMISGDVDLQVRTAKTFPRSISKFKQQALEMVAIDKETAGSCNYAYKRGGKIIEGPSTRLAEIIASSWGNIRVAARTTGADGGFIYAESVCWDLESNVAVSYETRRRITKSDGQMFSDDMVGVTGNAAVSIAFRNSVFRVVPRAYVNEVWKASRKVAAGEVKDLKQRRSEMLGYFESQGVSEDRILVLLGISDIDDITLEMLSTLRGFATAIKDGLTSIEAIFSRHDEQDVEQPQTEKSQDEKTEAAPADESQPSGPGPSDLDNQKAKLVNEICSQVGRLHPGDDPEGQAARLRLLKYIFGQTQVDGSGKMPSQILEAGLEYLKSRAVGDGVGNDDIPF